ncbi:MAG: carboxylating nicotinate-nucleotide diphosphorylase [Maricaulaceae bacterium]
MIDLTPWNDPAPLPRLVVERAVRTALEEDLGGSGDITSLACVPETAQSQAQIVSRGDGILAGVDAVRCAFELVDPKLSVEIVADDGADVQPQDVIARVQGSARSVLAAERTALNFLAQLSGVATLTRRYVDAVDGTLARIAATRKTVPGLRALQKHAVRVGGGVAHRFGLDDAVLIKDNHIAVAGGIAKAMRAAQGRAGHMVRLAVEVDTLDQLDAVLPLRPDVVLLDNFFLEDLEEAVRRTAGAVVLEASGGVTLETVRAIAETGVDVVSVGALTHSSRALDVGLDF